MRKRCSWVPAGDTLYETYHDTEWGIPCHDDKKLYELFLLELFQAGLSWRLILGKRDNFRRAFEGFDAKKIAAYGEEKIAALAQDKGIIRHEKKIRAAVKNASVFIAIQKEYGSFDTYLWHFTDGKTIKETAGVTKNALSDRVSNDLKQRGAQYAGSTSIYSLLQAAGIIDSHEEGCWKYKK